MTFAMIGVVVWIVVGAGFVVCLSAIYITSDPLTLFRTSMAFAVPGFVGVILVDMAVDLGAIIMATNPNGAGVVFLLSMCISFWAPFRLANAIEWALTPPKEPKVFGEEMT